MYGLLRELNKNPPWCQKLSSDLGPPIKTQTYICPLFLLLPKYQLSFFGGKNATGGVVFMLISIIYHFCGWKTTSTCKVLLEWQISFLFCFCFFNNVNELFHVIQQ